MELNILLMCLITLIIIVIPIVITIKIVKKIKQRELEILPIELSISQKRIISAIKMHNDPLIDKSLNVDTTFEYLKELYSFIYGYTFEDTNEYKQIMMNSLLRIYYEIQEDYEFGLNSLDDLLYIACNKTITRDHDNPYDRLISELYGRIQSNSVQGRYDLDWNNEKIKINEPI